MKKILLFSIVFMFVLAGESAKTNIGKTDDFIYSTVIDKGIKRTIRIPKETTVKSGATPNDVYDATAQRGIILRFKDPKAIDIRTFESRYGLSLKTKLRSGYMIFENRSKMSDLELIKRIIADKKNIDTIKPNWKLGKKPY